jgi:hypothetical protein
MSMLSEARAALDSYRVEHRRVGGVWTDELDRRSRGVWETGKPALPHLINLGEAVAHWRELRLRRDAGQADDVDVEGAAWWILDALEPLVDWSDDWYR